MGQPEPRTDISRCLLNNRIEMECRVQDVLGPSDIAKCNIFNFF